MAEENGPNTEAIEAWDTVLFEKFARFRPIVNPGYAKHGTLAIKRLARAIDLPGKKLMDLGCGFGDTTQELARRVGPSGRAVGIDPAERFLEVARREAAAAKLENLHFVAKDAQLDDLGGPYDAAYSRMGLMFCSNPVQLFRNVKRHLKEGGYLCAVVWRRREDNEWLYAAELIVRELIPEKDKGENLTCGPGPFSMAGADMVSDQLLKAGFKEITFERHDDTLIMGSTVEQAIDIALELGPAGEIIRLAGEDGERRKPEVVARLRERFGRIETPAGIAANASTWIVLASA